jgi:hypothetical protein
MSGRHAAAVTQRGIVPQSLHERAHGYQADGETIRYAWFDQGDLKMQDRPPPQKAPLVPAALLDPVVAYFNPRRVIVFGSVARGEAGPDSDIDLLVILDDDTPAEKVTLKAGYESRKSYHQPADVIPVREAVSRRNSLIAGTLSRAAILDGVVVYDRP